MDEPADARRILTAVPQSEWRRLVGRPYTSWMATLKNDLARHNLTLEDAIFGASRYHIFTARAMSHKPAIITLGRHCVHGPVQWIVYTESDVTALL